MQDFSFKVKGSDGSETVMEVRQKHPQLSKRTVKTWSSDEDDLLLSLYQQHPKRWGVIAAKMGDRN